MPPLIESMWVSIAAVCGSGLVIFMVFMLVFGLLRVIGELDDTGSIR